MLSFCKTPGEDNFILFVCFVRNKDTGEIRQTVLYPSPDFPVDRSLEKFAFPWSDALYDTDFSFCLTSQNAAPTYGYVRMKFTWNEITSYCVLSQFFYPRDYFDLIDRYLETKSHRFLESQRLREPDCHEAKAQQMVKELITHGLSIFSLPDICTILIAMLLDCRIVVIGDNLRTLSRFCYALLAFIHPLPWPGVFIPILPDELVATLYAPFPYIVGIHCTLISATQVPEMESHVLVNVDSRWFQFVKMDLKIPKEVRKKIDGITTLMASMPIDKAVRKVMLSAVEHVCKQTMKNPAAFVAKYKKKQAKMQPGKNGLKFKDAVLESQLVNSLMREVEAGPSGEVFTAFTSQAPPARPVSGVTEPVRLTPARGNHPRPMSVMVERPITVGPAPVPVPPAARPRPQPKLDTPADTFQEIARLADLFKKRNTNIDEKIRESRSSMRPITAVGSNPEALGFRSRLSIFQTRNGSPSPPPVLQRAQMPKTRTMSTIQKRTEL